MTEEKIALHWFRRDLRLEDNTALNAALRTGLPVLGVFVFDPELLEGLPRDDARVTFIHQSLRRLHRKLEARGSSLLVLYDRPERAWEKMLESLPVAAAFWNRDYEPYARRRDARIQTLLEGKGVRVETCKDQVVFEPEEILKSDGKPYTVFTPYRTRWRARLAETGLPAPVEAPEPFLQLRQPFPTLESIGFVGSDAAVPPFDLGVLERYEKLRDLPAEEGTSRLGPHLRFGTVSIRAVVRQALERSSVFLDELIWREFFMQVLWHFPHSAQRNFKPQYDALEWLNRESDFEAWRRGRTGYPLVDAGMRQLAQTGYLHNRVRMVCASFLCKHLLIDWRRGEAWFAQKLLDYELSSNVGNWQWAAGTGCDAAPYFRIFNPETQRRKFDPARRYIRRWLPELDTPDYPNPIVEHRFARQRALQSYKEALRAHPKP